MYFTEIPQILYKFGDTEKLVTNIFVSIRKKSDADAYQLFQSYHIEDGDTPEIVADKIYGHTKWWWVVLLVAGIVKPTDWPQASDDIDKLMERFYGSDYYHVYQLLDDNGDPAPQRVLMQFHDNEGNLINWHEHGEGLGVERFGVITVRGNKTPVDQIAHKLNDAKRAIKVLNPAYLGDFVDDFRTRINERASDGSVNF